MGPYRQVETYPGPAGGPPAHAHHRGVLAVAWQHKWLVALCVTVSLVLGTAHYLRQPDEFQSSSQVLVSSHRVMPLPNAGADEILNYAEVNFINAHLRLIQSPRLARKAVAKLDPARASRILGGGSPEAMIVGGLTVTRDEKASSTSDNIILLGYRGPLPDECNAVLEAVIATYVEYLEERSRSKNNELAKTYLAQQDNVDKELRGMEADRAELRGKVLDAVGDGIPPGKDGNGLQWEPVATIQNEMIKLKNERDDIHFRLERIARARAGGASREQTLAMVADWSRAGQGQPAAAAPAPVDQLAELSLEKESLLADYGPRHPDVLAVEAKLRRLRQAMAEAPPDGAGADFSDVTVRAFEQSLKAKLEELDEQLKGRGEKYEAARARATKVSAYLEEEAKLQPAMERAQKKYDDFSEAIKAVQSFQDAEGFTYEVLHEPASFQIGPKALPIFGMAALLGLAAGTGLGYVAQFLDKSFHTPDEIRTRLGVPVIGHLPVVKPPALAETGPGPHPTLLAYHLPRSLPAEAFRSLRTALFFSNQGGDTKVVQVTSPGMGDGKSTVIANLALSIAQSGKRVLLVDADLRRPRQHKLFGLAARGGLADVIAGAAELPEVTSATAQENLWLLPAGHRPQNPSELLTSPRFQELLALLRDRYDYVLVDTPPLLVVTDPSVVAARVDGVVLVLRLSNKEVRPQAERAREMLTALNSNLLGVIANAVPEGGRGYGGYGYGYSYGYGYYSKEYYSDDPEDGTGGGDAAATGATPAAPQVNGDGRQD